jgi:hypothetical protein
MMSDSKPSKVTKKAYTKPKLTEVRLAAQEAVLAVCKNNNGIKSQCVPDLICLATPRS